MKTLQPQPFIDQQQKQIVESQLRKLYSLPIDDDTPRHSDGSLYNWSASLNAR